MRFMPPRDWESLYNRNNYRQTAKQSKTVYFLYRSLCTSTNCFPSPVERYEAGHPRPIRRRRRRRRPVNRAKTHTKTMTSAARTTAGRRDGFEPRGRGKGRLRETANGRTNSCCRGDGASELPTKNDTRGPKTLTGRDFYAKTQQQQQQQTIAKRYCQNDIFIIIIIRYFARRAKIGPSKNTSAAR